MRIDTRNGPRSIVITGAGAGLGEALALHYAAPGRMLGLIARASDRLEAVAIGCRAKGAEVASATLDVRDGIALAGWLAKLDAHHPLDLVIVNAGVFSGIGADGQLEAPDRIRTLIGIDLEGAILTANAAASLMRPRKRGQIALISSLAARQPQADAPAYSAAKAGLSAYAEALRERLAPEGIGISDVQPGHILSAQTAIQRGPMPFMLTPAKAALTIAAGLGRGRAHIAFPWPLVMLIAIGRCLPWRLRAWAGRSLRFTVCDPEKHNR
jgi:short-subunit dehydrogenase